MKTIYISDKQGFIQVPRLQDQAWVHLHKPTQQEIEDTAKQLSVPQKFFDAALSDEERSRIEHEGSASLFLLPVPWKDESVDFIYDDVKYKTQTLGLIFTPKHVLTVSHSDYGVDKAFCVRHQIGLDQDSQTNLLAGMIYDIARAYAATLKELDMEVSQAEAELSRSYRNQELFALLYLNESLIYMTTALKQLRNLMSRLRQDQGRVFSEAERERWDDSMVEIEQVHAVASISQINLNNVMDAYGNIIQNNVSHVVKLLTSVTIVLSVPTLIASIYGMNVPLPFQDEPEAFNVLIGLMVTLSVVLALVFQRKRYF